MYKIDTLAFFEFRIDIAIETFPFSACSYQVKIHVVYLLGQ
jgi:hypothetical protein